MNKHNKTEAVKDAENKQVVTRGEEGGGEERNRRKIKRYKFPVKINESQV